METPSKKIKNNSEDILSNAYDLLNQYSTFCKLFGYYEGFGKLMKKTQNSIPTIASWGSQSSGKSTSLNKIFGLSGKFKLPTNFDLCTRFPIILKANKTYIENEIILHVIGADKHIPFDSIEDAHNFVNREYPVRRGENDIIEVELEIKICSDNNLIIIDLPGVSTVNSKIMENIRNTYLTRKNLIILHYSRFDVDPYTDHSNQLILNTPKNKTIGVLTHTDNQSNYMDRHFEVNQYSKYALVNHFENKKELDCVNNIKLKGDLIRGSNSLSNFLVEFSDRIVKENSNELKQLITKFKEDICYELNSIGRVEEPSTSHKYRFVASLIEKIDNLYKSGTDEIKKINEIKDTLTIEHIKKMMTVDKEEIMANEMRSRRSGKSVTGSEGFEYIVENHVRETVDKLNPILTNWGNVFLNEIKDGIIKKISSTSNPYFYKAIQHCTEKIKEMIIQVEKEYKIFTDEEMSKIIKSQDNPTDENIRRLGTREKFILKIIINYLKRNRSGFANQCVVLSDEFIEKLYNDTAYELSSVDPYLDQAYFAHNKIKQFWDKESSHIKKNFQSWLENKKYEILEKIKEFGRTQKDDMFTVTENILQRRELLLTMEEICDKIIKSV